MSVWAGHTDAVRLPGLMHKPQQISSLFFSIRYAVFEVALRFDELDFVVQAAVMASTTYET